MFLTPCPSVYMFFQFFYTYLPFRNKYGIIAARKRIHAHIHSFKRVMYMCKEEDKVMILDPANKKQIRKKPILKTDKFANLNQADWKEANEISKSSRGVSDLTFKDLYGGK